MRLLDDRGRLWGRFNPWNAALVLVVVVALALGLVRLVAVRQAGLAQTEDVLVTFEVPGVRQASIDAVREGEQVYGFENQIPLGPVVSKRVEPHREPVPTATGQLVLAPVPGRYDLYLTVKVRAVAGPNAVSVSGRHLKIGVKLNITGRLFIFEAVIADVEEATE
ncbi:MAG: DUF4330 domain-containing protein [Firmicutes bacterium]|nr:DUF4330 domain-containing protein [Bacillota bacterium]